MPDIKIKLKIEDAEAAEEVKRVAQAGAEALQAAYTKAVDSAKSKLFELSEAEKVVGATIQLNIAKIGELQSKRQQATEADKSSIDQEIASLQKLIAARESDLSKINEKKAKLEGAAAQAVASNEGEKLAIQLVTQQRLIDINALRDQQRAVQQIKDLAGQAAADNKADLEEINRKQSQQKQTISELKNQIGQLESARSSASTTTQAELDKEIAGLQRSVNARENELLKLDAKRIKIQEEGSIAASTTDQERQNIQKTTDAELAKIAALQATIKAQQQVKDITDSTVESASNKINELNRRQQEATAIIGTHKQKIEELQKSRQEGDAEQNKKVDDEIVQLKKLIATREEEIVEIEKKKLRLGEEIALALSGSDQERAAIQEQTSKRRVEIEAIAEQKSATEQLSGAQKEGTSALSEYFALFSGAGAVIAFWQQLQTLLEDNKRILDGIVDAGNQLRDKSATQFDKMKPFFNEFGLTTAAQQTAGQGVINDIAKSNNLEQSVIADTAGELAAPLKQNGVTDMNSDRFKQLVGNAGRFVNRGLNSRLLADFTSDQLKANPNLTGDQLNQNVSDLLAVTDGSTSRANEILRVFQEDKPRFAAAGFGLQDVEKFFSQLQKSGVSAYEAPTVARQYFHGLDRLVGLSPKQIEEVHGELQDFAPEKAQELKEMGQLYGPAQMVKEQERLRKTGIPELDAAFEDGVKTGKLDIRRIAEIIGKLPQEQRERAARTIAGPRGAVALTQAAGFEGVQLPSGSALSPVPDSADQTSRVAKEQSDAESAARNTSDPYAAQFTADVANESTVVSRNADDIKDFWDRHPTFTNIMTVGAAHPATTEEIAAARVLVRRLVALGRVRSQMASGKLKYTSAQAKQLQDSMSAIMGLLQQGGTTQPDEIQALAGDIGGTNENGDKWSLTEDQALKDYDANPEAFLRQLDTAALSTYSGAIKDDRAAAPILRGADDAVKSIMGSQSAPPSTTAKPTTRPASTQPVSINYHVRQTNYGYGYDQIGGPQSFDNLLG